MSNSVAADELRLLIERVERIEEEIKGLRADKRDVFAEAKSRGFDTATMKDIIKLRAMDENTRREREAMLDTYKAALGMLDGTPLGHWAIERLSKGEKPAEPPTPDHGDAAAVLPENAAEAPAPEPEATVEDARRMGGEAARSGTPVTANPFPARDPRRAAWDEAWCHELGSDGMDIPDALKPTPKPKKGGPGDKPEGEE